MDRSDAARSPSLRTGRIGFAIACLIILGGAAATMLAPSRPAAVAASSESEKTSAFLPTVENTARPSGPAPEGMVWIPGGTFSMGSDVASEGLCCQKGTTRDSQPVHRVY